jgi:hypothetical protein
MSGYVPSTEEVLTAASYHGGGSAETIAERRQEVERWLAGVKAEAARDTEKRARDKALMALSWSGETTWRQARSAVEAALSIRIYPERDASA